MKTLKSGTTGWFLLTGFVIGWDLCVGWLLQGETLTGAFRKATKHPISRWPVVLAWGITTFHLFGWLDPRVDPFYRCGQLISRRGQRRELD